MAMFGGLGIYFGEMGWYDVALSGGGGGSSPHPTYFVYGF